MDDHYVIPGDSSRVAYKASQRGALDFGCYVPRRAGCATLFSNPPIGIWREWELDVNQPQKEFKAKHAFLGFDPVGAMLYLGRCNGEDVWGAWVPEMMFEDDSYIPVRTGTCSGDTRLSQEIYRWTLVFLAIVCEIQGISNITINSYYPVSLDDMHDVRFSTNIT